MVILPMHSLGPLCHCTIFTDLQYLCLLAVPLLCGHRSPPSFVVCARRRKHLTLIITPLVRSAPKPSRAANNVCSFVQCVLSF